MDLILQVRLKYNQNHIIILTTILLSRKKEIDTDLKGLDAKSRKEKEKEIQKISVENSRLARKKFAVKDFENVKLVGRGAFGEV